MRFCMGFTHDDSTVITCRNSMRSTTGNRDLYKDLKVFITATKTHYSGIPNASISSFTISSALLLKTMTFTGRSY